MQDCAEEIEADLYFRGIDIFDWYRGKISDRRLLVLLRYLPEDSAFKSVMREHDWPLQEHLQTGTLNEIKAMRGDLWALLGHELLPFNPVLPPSSKRARDAKRAMVRAVHDDVIAQLRGRNRDVKAG